MMKIEELLHKLNLRENLELEFGSRPEDLRVSGLVALFNTHGGWILLGVRKTRAVRFEGSRIPKP